MERRNVILLIIFFVLILLMSVEIGFILGTKKASGRPSSYTYPSPIKSTPAQFSIASSSGSVKPDLMKIANYIDETKKDVLKDTLFTYIYEGKVVSIETTGGTTTRNGKPFTYALRLHIQGLHGSTVSLVFDKQEVSIMQIVKTTNGSSTSASLADVIPGTIIRLIAASSLLTNDPIKTQIIIK